MGLAKLLSHRADLEFLVIGSRNPFVEQLERDALNEANPARLRFLGYVDDPVEALRQVNVVVSLSHIPESFGRTIVEGMAARRPVFVYDQGSAPELVSHGNNGFLLPYLDFPAAIPYLEALADDPGLMIGMGQNGRARAEECFSSSVFAAGLASIYQQIFRLSDGR